jgi:hypothetical protein
LDDQPATELAGGTVTFTSSELRKSASGEIQADGSYRLGSLTKDDGAIPGKYEVTVSPPETPVQGERKKRQDAAAVPVLAAEKLEVTVEAKTNDVPIHLHRGRPARR